MRMSVSRAVALSTLVLTALATSACAGRGGGKADTPYVARDVNTLYAAAKDRLDRGQYKEAAALFDEVERQHPYSIWARRAQVMGAFSYYLAQDYTQAIQSSQRFLSVHPGNRDAPYAYYLIALSYYEQISDVTRDQKITQQALDALGELSRRYPNTRYAADARLKMDLVRDHLAGKEMEIG
ncbi:outer membrane protein assembly factor BamD, partial [uncultured Sphingomonas sp.]